MPAKRSCRVNETGGVHKFYGRVRVLDAPRNPLDGLSSILFRLERVLRRWLGKRKNDRRNEQCTLGSGCFTQQLPLRRFRATLLIHEPRIRRDERLVCASFRAGSLDLHFPSFMWHFFGIVVACTRKVKLYAKHELFLSRSIQRSAARSKFLQKRRHYLASHHRSRLASRSLAQCSFAVPLHSIAPSARSLIRGETYPNKGSPLLRRRKGIIYQGRFFRSRCSLADDADLNRANKPDEILESIARVFPKEFIASNKKAHRSLSLYSIELGLFGRDTSALAPAREGKKKEEKKKKKEYPRSMRCQVRRVINALQNPAMFLIRLSIDDRSIACLSRSCGVMQSVLLIPAITLHFEWPFPSRRNAEHCARKLTGKI